MGTSIVGLETSLTLYPQISSIPTAMIFFVSNADRFVPLVRNTKDKIVNRYDIRLHFPQFKDCEWQSKWDLLGKYTCYNVKGSSTVDLFITSDALLSNIIQLKVSTSRFRSCHFMVNMTIKVDQLLIEEPMLHEVPPNFLWNNLYKITLILIMLQKNLRR